MEQNLCMVKFGKAQDILIEMELTLGSKITPEMVTAMGILFENQLFNPIGEHIFQYIKQERGSK